MRQRIFELSSRCRWYESVARLRPAAALTEPATKSQAVGGHQHLSSQYIFYKSVFKLKIMHLLKHSISINIEV